MKKTVNTKESNSNLNTINTNKKGAITMKKTGIRTKIIAAVLAAVTICSVGTMAFSASAMTVNAASIDTTTISQELEEYGDAAKNLLNRITDDTGRYRRVCTRRQDPQSGAAGGSGKRIRKQADES